MTDTKQLYDSLGATYLTSMYSDNAWTRYVDIQEKALIKNLLSSPANHTILDLGMGPGRWSKFFVDIGFRQVTGIDISLAMVTAAQKYISSAKFSAVQADMTKLPFPKHRFDYVFCFRAFKYVSRPDQALDQIHVVLKPGSGKFVLEVSNASLLNRLLKFAALVYLKLFPHTSLVSRWRYFDRANFYSKSQITKLLSDHGFLPLDIYPLFVLPSIPLPQFLVPYLMGVDNALLHLLPTQLFARSWVIPSRVK